MSRRSARPELVRVRTRDGWRLAVHRYRTARQTSRWGPVVLCHGLGANRFNLDAPSEEISLARYLRARGHDCWVVELRGAGLSRPPGWPLRRRRRWDFDDYVQKDVPAIIRRVLDQTGAPSINWVGHSMGGMLAYAAMIQYEPRIFRSVTTIASPAFTGVKHPLVDRLYRLRSLLRLVPWLPYSRIGWLGAIFPGITVKGLGVMAANAEQMDPAHIRALAPRVLTDLPAPLLAQFAEWYGSTGGFARNDGLMAYWEHLDRVRSPLLVLAGGVDVLTPVQDLEDVYRAVGARDKKLVVADRAHGFAVDYGHIDLVLGTHARREIYPLIAEWIETH